MSAAKLISRLLTIYGTPRTDDPAAFIAEYEKVLKPYGSDVLERAGDEIIRTIGPFWPKPSEALKVVRQVAHESWVDTYGREPKPDPDYERPTQDQKDRAQAILNEFVRAMAEKEINFDPKPKVAIDVNAFEEMQRKSRTGLHRLTLTERSRRMMGGD